MATVDPPRDGRPYKVGDSVNIRFEDGDVIEGEFECATCGVKSKTKLTVIGTEIRREFPEGSCPCVFA